MLSRNFRRLLQAPALSRRSIHIPCKNVRASTSSDILNIHSYSYSHRYQSSESSAANDGAAESVPTAPRGLPTKHSRHLPPPVAPAKILDDSSEDILKSIPGTLFGYDPANLHLSKTEEYELALSECHSLQQQVEYILRGYSSLLHGSIVNLQNNTQPPKGNNVDVDADETIQKMLKLIERIELEGDTYVKLRSKYRSQLARVSNAANDDEDTDADGNGDSTTISSNSGNDGTRNAGKKGDAKNTDNDDDSANSNDANAWNLSQLVQNFGAPPGPTSAMYDLVLDAIAVSIPSSPDQLALLKISRTLYEKALERHDLDVKAETDGLNPSSCPSPVTFNAHIRAAANVTVKDDETRDWAFENTFYAYDAMHHHSVVHRNSATYKYLFDSIRIHFPISEMRGNISCGLWHKSTTEKVLDQNVIESMKLLSNEGEHSEEFTKWWKNTEEKYDPKKKDGYGYPKSWGKNKKLRRFDKRFDVY